ncbi:MAG: zinc metalloprotease HtpX [Candidatus Omnitrophota bacterium]
MTGLKFRMYLLLVLLFAIIYAVISIIGVHMGISNFYFYIVLSAALMFAQYMLGPKLVELSMRVKYAEKAEYPHLHAMVADLASRAGIPVPKLGISEVDIPNAFAFGRGRSDGRVCVTRGILRLLNNEELKAVLGHEITHLKNRDVLAITILSVIPMILYRVAWHFLWFGGGRRREQGSNAALIGIAAFMFYFITNLLVLYGSRVREYFADRGSIELGNSPATLAAALYKLVYGSARMKKEAIRNVEGFKAFFVNDPSRAVNEIKELARIDINNDGTIDENELRILRNKHVTLAFRDKMMECMSTHPDMLKRVKRLAEYRVGSFREGHDK